jgi:hypothetical protein
VIAIYAITDDPGPPLPVIGSLRAVPVDGLAAICAPAGQPDVSEDALWRHEEVVEALMEDRDLLPVRYGTLLDDEAAAARVVDERREQLSAALDRVRGAVELSVRVIAPADRPDPEPGGTGAGYLRAKVRTAEARDALAACVHEPLAALARATFLRPPKPPAEVLRAAYLVDRGAVAGFTGRVAELERANPRLQLLCTGPWPPYSFAGS